MRAGEKRPLSPRILGSLALALSRNLSRLPNWRLAGIHQTDKGKSIPEPIIHLDIPYDVFVGLPERESLEPYILY